MFGKQKFLAQEDAQQTIDQSTTKATITRQNSQTPIKFFGMQDHLFFVNIDCMYNHSHTVIHSNTLFIKFSLMDKYTAPIDKYISSLTYSIMAV